MYKLIALLVLIAAVAVGCSRPQSDPDNDAEVSALGKKYLTEQEPADAQGVAEAIQADDATEVTVVGRIGGEIEPMIDGLAAFTIVDPSLKACSDIPGDACETPWDYC